ncbi:MAG TPA: hypothetical protein VEJ63_17435 [Planctomycetota bacterium]|nr:hypothetical protein [Planctomycetota bacterium]
MRLLLVLFCALSAASAFTAADGFKVTTDRTVDSSSLESIVSDVVRLSGAKTNDEKGIAIYNYLNQVLFHNAYPNEKAPQSVGPLKVINVYGWGLCGGQHTVMKALFETAGWPVRYRGWSNPGHTTVETQYDGKWHYFDVFLRAYYWTKDKQTIAGQDDINADPSIALDGAKDGRVPKDSYLACGDEAAGVVSGCKSSKPTGVYKPEQGWASVTGRDVNYSPLLTLRSGAALRLEWAGVPDGMVALGTKGVHTCPNLKDVRNDPVLGPVFEHYGTRNYSNGTFVYAPNFAKSGDVADIELTNAKATDGKLAADGAASAIFKLNLPYPYAKATLAAEFDGEGKLSISPDGGKTWQGAQNGDVSALVRQRYDVWIKAEFSGALKSLKLDAVIEHNRGAQPFLYNGKNTITVSTKDNKLPADSVLVVTYAYQEATSPSAKRQFNGKGVTYSDTKTVSKEVTALPFTFDIEVGGNTPPKMMAIERAIRPK